LWVGVSGVREWPDAAQPTTLTFNIDLAKSRRLLRVLQRKMQLVPSNGRAVPTNEAGSGEGGVGDYGEVAKGCGGGGRNLQTNDHRSAVLSPDH
jgi:hypothetical protein